MNKSQSNWAAKHDWYEATLPDGTILVNDTHSAGHTTTLRFDNFEELYHWAGY